MTKDDSKNGDDSLFTSASDDLEEVSITQNKGGFRSPPTGEHATGGFRSPPTGEHATGGFRSPPTGEHATGGFRSPPTGEHATGGGSRTGPQSSISTTGSSSNAVSLVTGKMRLAYGSAGFIAGAISGLALGLLNSGLEGVTLFDGLGLTLQISGWFAILFGVVCAWKPERFVSMLRQWDLVD